MKGVTKPKTIPPKKSSRLLAAISALPVAADGKGPAIEFDSLTEARKALGMAKAHAMCITTRKLQDGRILGWRLK